MLFQDTLFFFPLSCHLQQRVPQQREDEESDVAGGDGDPGPRAFCVAVVGVAAMNTHSGRSRSVPPRPLAEGPERAGLHHPTWNRATLSPRTCPGPEQQHQV